MFLTKWLMTIILSSRMCKYRAHCQDSPQACNAGYDISEFVSQLNLQFCTFVEVGQGYCSMFVEFRKDPSCAAVSPDTVAEIYLGTCECATMKDWDLCSIPLRKSRPYECYLDDLEPARRNGSARIHRRLCDPTKMFQIDQPCDCAVPFAQRTLYPVKGFLTCYRAPLPRSICSTHSVCGVYNCEAKNLLGLSMVYCDPLCLGKQPFCEELGPITSRPPVVTSFWSEWTCPHKDDIVEVSEAICIDKETNSPAFDCLGPGSFCCPPNTQDCRCEVSTTMAEMKVTRYVFNQDMEFKKRHIDARSAMFNSHSKKQKKLWEQFKQNLHFIGKKKQSFLKSASTTADFFEESSTMTNFPFIKGLNQPYTYKSGALDTYHSRINSSIKNNLNHKIYNEPEHLKQIAIINKPSKQVEKSFMVINYKPVRPASDSILLAEEEDDSPWRKSRFIIGNNTKYNYLQEFNFFAPRR